MEADPGIEVKTVGTCVTRNGTSKISQVRIDVDRFGQVDVHFVSGKLKRALHAGFTIPQGAMDELCRKWFDRKGIQLVAAAPEVDNRDRVLRALDAAASAVARARELADGDKS